MTVKKEEHGASDRAASLAVTPPHLQATMYQVIQATVSRGYMSKHLNKEILVLKQEQGSYRLVCTNFKDFSRTLKTRNVTNT